MTIVGHRRVGKSFGGLLLAAALLLGCVEGSRVAPFAADALAGASALETDGFFFGGRGRGAQPAPAPPSGAALDWVVLESASESDLRRLVMSLRQENDRLEADSMEALSLRLELAERNGQLAQAKEENAALSSENSRLERALGACAERLAAAQAQSRQPPREEDEEGTWNVSQVLHNLVGIVLPRSRRG